MERGVDRGSDRPDEGLGMLTERGELLLAWVTLSSGSCLVLLLLLVGTYMAPQDAGTNL